MNYDSLVSQAHFLRIKALSLAEGMKSGNFRSLQLGQGIEMSSVRDYIRGDDIRAIDWNVTARMGKPYVKVFEEQHELQIFLIVDKSLSMTIKNENRTKYDVATEAAALIAFAAEINDCPIGAVFFNGKITSTLPPVSGREQTMLLISHLEKQPEQVPGSALEAALNGAGQKLKKRSLVFILSDFRTTGYEKALGQLSHKNDVIAVRIENKFDKELPSLGSFPFIDVESGLKQTFPTSSKKFQKAWREAETKRKKDWNDFCLKNGITPVSMNTEQDVLRILSDIFENTRG